MNRRRWLQLVFALAAWLRGTIAAGAVSNQGAPDTRQLSAFAPFLDTLIPADATPSATQLGVHTRLLAFPRDAPGVQLLAGGCAWLDAEAHEYGKPGFADLADAQREAIVARAATAPPGSLPYVFFQRMRSDAMRVYYALPGTWTSLGYDGPPQPRGFLDHARPPKRGR